MITFIMENWSRLRAPNARGHILAWPLAASAVAVVSVFYGVIAAVSTAAGWLWRLVWPRRAGGPADDGPEARVFYSAPAGRPSGAGGAYGYVGGEGAELPSAHQPAQAAQQRQAAQLLAEREQAWADELANQEEWDDDPFGEGAMYDPRHHPARHDDSRRGEGYGDGRQGSFRSHRPRPHRPRRHGRRGRRRPQVHRGRPHRVQLLFG